MPREPDAAQRFTRCQPAGALVCTRTESGSEISWVHVAGELDCATAPLLAQNLRLAQLRASLIVVDLRALQFMACCGIDVLVHASVRARHAGRRLIVVRGIDRVDRVFALTGTTDAVEFVTLHPMEPPVQALLQVARFDAAA